MTHGQTDVRTDSIAISISHVGVLELIIENVTVMYIRKTARRGDDVAQSEELERGRLQREARQSRTEVRTANLDVQVRSDARGK